MKRNIQIEALAQIPLEKQRIELVERKCIGHPDSIADGVAEAISRALCREYIEEFWRCPAPQYRPGRDCSRGIRPEVWWWEGYPPDFLF